MTVILKLGGSVITDKNQPETLDEIALDRSISSIAAGTVDDLVLIHGGGSYGHYHADRFGVSPTNGTHDATQVYAIHDAMKRLNHHVISTCHAHEVPALPIHPFSVCTRNTDGVLEIGLEAVITLLDEGFIPVLHGDIIANSGMGGTIVSGDELVALLAGQLGATRVGMCSSEPGVLSDDGTVIPEITSLASVESVLSGAGTPDVTGGMGTKIKALLELDVPAAVFGINGIDRFLEGGWPGTKIP